MMRRSAKPFTVEVKRTGRVRKDGHAPSIDANTASIVGGDIRFRDAERMFRNPPPDEADVPPARSPFFQEPPRETSPTPALERRILPDLIAEAALTEQVSQHPPEQPRRRGRPRKERTGDAASAPMRRGRPRLDAAVVDEAPTVEDADVAVPVVAPVLLDLAASARRRAARDTSSLPRGERWKRRLPKVCW